MDPFAKSAVNTQLAPASSALPILRGILPHAGEIGKVLGDLFGGKKTSSEEKVESISNLITKLPFGRNQYVRSAIQFGRGMIKQRPEIDESNYPMNEIEENPMPARVMRAPTGDLQVKSRKRRKLNREMSEERANAGKTAGDYAFDGNEGYPDIEG